MALLSISQCYDVEAQTSKEVLGVLQLIIPDVTAKEIVTGDEAPSCCKGTLIDSKALVPHQDTSIPTAVPMTPTRLLKPAVCTSTKIITRKPQRPRHSPQRRTERWIRRGTEYLQAKRDSPRIRSGEMPTHAKYLIGVIVEAITAETPPCYGDRGSKIVKTD